MGVALAMFASFFVLRLKVDNPADGISLLYALPVALVAVSMGWRAGLISAGVSLALYYTYATVEHVPVSAIGYGTRAAAFGLLGGLLGAFADRSRAADRALLSHASELTALMRRIDPLEPGHRGVPPGDTAERELAVLTHAFNEMLDRLETERRESAWRELSSQEADRGRISRELHDEVGQVLTAVVLHLERLSQRASSEIAAELAATRDLARSSLEDVRRIMHELRPEVLDDLGLASALGTLSTQFSRHAGIPVGTALEDDLPRLTPEAELVVYRIAQEGLTNAARHSGCSRIAIRLEQDGDQRLALYVRDDGVGVNRAGAGSGVRGMRERAVAIGADLTLSTPAGGGTELKLVVDALKTVGVPA
jgi:two-component system sensor histidine kinase UhpB